MDDALKTYLRSIAQRLRLVRWHAKLTQEGVAGRAGITHRYYADLEAGRRNASLDTMLRVADALGAPVGLLLDMEPEKTRRRLAALMRAKPEPLKAGRRSRKRREP